MSFKRTRREIINEAPTYDLKYANLGESLERLERQVGWHGADDSANRNTIKACTTLAQAIVIANDLKTKFTAHIALGAVTHKAADATNTISASAATDQSSLDTLLNELKEELNDHIALAAAHDVGSTTGLGEAAAALAPVDLINTVLSADSSSLATALVLANELQYKFYSHTFRGPIRIDELLTLNP